MSRALARPNNKVSVTSSLSSHTLSSADAVLLEPPIAHRFVVVRRLSSSRRQRQDVTTEPEDDKDETIFEAIDRHTVPQTTVALMLVRAGTAHAQALLKIGALLQSPRLVRLMQSIPIQPKTFGSEKPSAGWTAMIWQYMAPPVSHAPTALMRPTLTSYIATRDHLFEKDVQVIIRRVAQALHVMHGEGYAFRGWSTERILLVSGKEEGALDSLKLRLSHGSCRARADGAVAEVDSLLASDGFGTARFLSPEAVNACFWPGTSHGGALYAAAKADMWALGVLMHVMLFGEWWPAAVDDPAWGRLRLLSSMRRAKSFDRIYDPLGGGKVSPDAYRLLGKLLEVDPARRLSSRECLMHPWILHSDPAAAHTAPVDEKASLVPTLRLFKHLDHSYEMDRLREGEATPTAKPPVRRRDSSLSTSGIDRRPAAFGMNSWMRERYEKICSNHRVKPNSQLIELWTLATSHVEAIDMTDNPIGSKGFACLLRAITLVDTEADSDDGRRLASSVPISLKFTRSNLRDDDVALLCACMTSSRHLCSRLKIITLDECPLVTCVAARKLLTTVRRCFGAVSGLSHGPGCSITITFRDCRGVSDKLKASFMLS